MERKSAMIEKSNEIVELLIGATEALAAATETVVFVELTPKFLEDFGELFGLTGKVYMPYATVEVKYESITGATLEIFLIGTSEGTPRIHRLLISSPYDKDVPLPYCSELEFYIEFLVNMSEAGYIKNIQAHAVFSGADINKLKEEFRNGKMHCLDD